MVVCESVSDDDDELGERVVDEPTAQAPREARAEGESVVG